MVEFPLPQNCSGFNGLPETDLVGEQIARQRVLQDPTDSSDLVRNEFYGRRDQPCESLASSLQARDRLNHSHAAIVEELGLSPTECQDFSRIRTWAKATNL